jgi:hypothetical protein
MDPSAVPDIIYALFADQVIALTFYLPNNVALNFANF